VTTRLATVEPSPDVFAAVMATGIVSIAASQHHYGRIAEILGVLASLGLVVLVALVLLTRRFSVWDLRDPDVTLRLFTFVAACAVLDSRPASQAIVVPILGAAALSSWLSLIVLSARNMLARTWTAMRDAARGAWELASVGTSGLAIVATKVARSTAEPWWLSVAVPVWAVALCIYALMTWLILCRVRTPAQRVRARLMDSDGRFGHRHAGR
jgi:Voltage-dependent anion channel